MDELKICVVGLGYVGLPVLLAANEKFYAVGIDINKNRLQELTQKFDSNGEHNDLPELALTSDISDCTHCNVFIITVPTPIRKDKTPDLSALVNASDLVSKVLKAGDLVIYESTVYPGATEEICIPILLKSGLNYPNEFMVGYSPERINPGDKVNQFKNITKVISGSSYEAVDLMERIYGAMIDAKLHKTETIKEAEAAKVIENTQRDVNVALINQFSQILDAMNVSTYNVLAAARTKWNFANFTPGLVGGHCIGVDPYYLASKAQMLGVSNDIILTARKTNDEMYRFIAQKFIKALFAELSIAPKDISLLVLGATFKTNCSDMRNSQVPKLCDELMSFGVNVTLSDPSDLRNHVILDNRLKFISQDNLIPRSFDGILIAVPHRQYEDAGYHFVKKLGKTNCVVFDLMNCFPLENDVLRM
jgi:UDP-N-acetyl-D-glucosamine/UDP-N-acetyl-D-galactosamine dehydrogenase